jgi:monoamine oxidase
LSSSATPFIAPITGPFTDPGQDQVEIPSCAVAVVGAGLAGLSAARALKRAGLSIRVLEARERVGGRTWSQPLGDDTRIDLGAQWIAPGQQRIQALVREFALATTRSHSRGAALCIAGGRTRRTPGISPASWLAQLDQGQMLLRLARLSRCLSALSAAAEALRRSLDQQPFAAWLAATAWTQAGREEVRLIVESGMCAPADEVSCLEVIRQLASIGGLGALAGAEHSFLSGGAQAIAQCLAGELASELHLAKPVTALRQDEHGVCITTPCGALCAQRVILAIPPQLLATLALDGELSRRAEWCKGAIVPGRVIKNVIVYDQAWWRLGGLNGMVAAPEGPIDHLVDGSNPEGRPGVLIAFATAHRAERLAAMEACPRQALILEHIRSSLGEAPAAPKAFHSIDWSADPLAQGGYASRLGPGCSTGDQPRLADPIGRVHFAGTETASQWRSYMEGALESGERAAKEVLAALGGG